MGNGRVTNNDLQEEQECLCSGKWRYSRTFPPKELPQGQEMRRLSLCAAVSGCAHSACLPSQVAGRAGTDCLPLEPEQYHLEKLCGFEFAQP